MNDGGVVRILPLLDHVVANDGHAAIGNVDAVATRAGAIIDAGIGDGGGLGAALDLVADIGVVEVAVVDDQRGEVIDIEVVRKAIAGAVVGELRTGDADRAGGAGVPQDAVLIVVEIAVDDDQVAALVADARAVHVGHGRAGEAQILDRHVGLRDEDALAVGWRHGGDEVRHATDTDDGDLLGDRREVVHIGAGLHGDGVAVTRGGDGRGQRRIGLPGPDIEGGRRPGPVVGAGDCDGELRGIGRAAHISDRVGEHVLTRRARHQRLGVGIGVVERVGPGAVGIERQAAVLADQRRSRRPGGAFAHARHAGHGQGIAQRRVGIAVVGQHIARRRRIAGDVAGAALAHCIATVGVVGRVRRVVDDRGRREGAVGELELLDAADPVRAIGTDQGRRPAGLRDRVGAPVAGERGHVGTRAAVDDIVAGAAVQYVVAQAAEQRVVTGQAEQHLGGGGADQRVRPVGALNDVGLVGAADVEHARGDAGRRKAVQPDGSCGRDGQQRAAIPVRAGRGEHCGERGRAGQRDDVRARPKALDLDPSRALGVDLDARRAAADQGVVLPVARREDIGAGAADQIVVAGPAVQPVAATGRIVDQHVSAGRADQRGAADALVIDEDVVAGEGERGVLRRGGHDAHFRDADLRAVGHARSDLVLKISAQILAAGAQDPAIGAHRIGRDAVVGGVLSAGEHGDDVGVAHGGERRIVAFGRTGRVVSGGDRGRPHRGPGGQRHAVVVIDVQEVAGAGIGIDVGRQEAPAQEIRLPLQHGTRIGVAVQRGEGAGAGEEVLLPGWRHRDVATVAFDIAVDLALGGGERHRVGAQPGPVVIRDLREIRLLVGAVGIGVGGFLHRA